MSPDESVGPLAEFTALRSEIDTSTKGQMQLFTLQLTVVGAIFGFVLSHSGLIALLLVIPTSSYLLGARYINLESSMLLAGRYITEELSDRVPGGLGWEEWWRAQHRRTEGLQGWAFPLWLSFPGAAILALGWSAASYIAQQNFGAITVVLAIVWLGEAALTALCITWIRDTYRLTWVPRNRATP